MGSGTREEEIATLAHELADAVVNFEGYADDAEEAERRRSRRDALEIELRRACAGEVAA